MQSAEELQKFRQALDKGWDKASESLPITFPRLKPLRNFENAELSESAKACREECKKAAEELADIFSSTSRDMVSDMERTRPAMEALLRLTLDFDAAYEKEKRRQVTSIFPTSSIIP
jgi:ATP-dependent exoDNAse (exonuclease V) beta subunit